MEATLQTSWNAQLYSQESVSASETNAYGQSAGTSIRVSPKDTTFSWRVLLNQGRNVEPRWKSCGVRPTHGNAK